MHDGRWFKVRPVHGVVKPPPPLSHYTELQRAVASVAERVVDEAVAGKPQPQPMDGADGVDWTFMASTETTQQLEADLRHDFHRTLAAVVPRSNDPEVAKEKRLLMGFPNQAAEDAWESGSASPIPAAAGVGRRRATAGPQHSAPAMGAVLMTRIHQARGARKWYRAKVLGEVLTVPQVGNDRLVPHNCTDLLLDLGYYMRE